MYAYGVKHGDFMYIYIVKWLPHWNQLIYPGFFVLCVMKIDLLS